MPLAVPVQAEQQLSNSESARLRMEDLHEEALARIDLLADSLEAAEIQASQAQVRAWLLWHSCRLVLWTGASQAMNGRIASLGCAQCCGTAAICGVRGPQRS